MGKSTTKDSKKAKTSEVLSKVKSGGISKPSKTSKSSSKELAKAAAQKLEKSKSKKKKVVEPESSSESESSESESESEASSSESESSEDEKVTKKPVTNGKPKAKAAASSDSESESESESESGSDSDSDSESEEETKAKAPAPKVNGTAKKVAAESSDSESDSAESDSDSDSDESEDEKPAAKVEAVKKTAESDDSDDSDDSEEDSDDSDDSDDSESDDAEEKKAEAPSKKRKAEEEIDEAPKKAKSEGQAATTLFVGSLSWSIDDDALYEAFKSFEPANARVVTDKNDGRSRGFGYVDFNDAESATKAYEAMQGQELEGRALNLDYANARTTEANPQNRAADRAKKHGDTISPESDTLFVGNLPFDVDQDIVREFFGEVAEVASVRLPTDPDSGNLKGFGYVTFNSIEDAKAVLDAKNGAPIGTGRMSRSVRLDFAGQRPQREGGGGFGGGFGGGRGGGRGGRGGGRGRGGDRGRGGGRGRGGFGGRGGFSTGANRTSFSGTKMTFD